MSSPQSAEDFLGPPPAQSAEEFLGSAPISPSAPPAPAPSGLLGEIGGFFGGLGQANQAAIKAHAGQTFAQRVLDPEGMLRAMGVALSFGPGEIGGQLPETVRPKPVVPGKVTAATEGLKAYLPRMFPQAPENRAIARIAERQKQDELAGGPTIPQIRQTINETPGKPQAYLDVGGENIRALAGHVGRAPGPSRTIVSDLYANRDPAAGDRLIQDVREHISNGGSAYDAIKALRTKAKTDSAPLYEEAFKPGSVAPLEHQFTQAFQEASRERAEASGEVHAANQKLLLATTKKARAGDNVYLSSAALREEREAKEALAAAQKKLAANTETLNDVRAALQEAQGAAQRGERGGVWSPQIGRLLRNPRVQEGLREGLAIQRDEADAAGIPFNPHDYAITGTDANGDPIVSKVPNMRALHAAKKGLDRMLEDYRDPTTGILHLNERGRAIDALRRSIVKELGRLNPTYAEANAAFAAPMRLVEAMEKGQNFRSMRPEEIRDILSNNRASDDPLTIEQRHEAFRQGVADRLILDIKGTARNADEAKKLLNNVFGDEQVRQIMENDPSFEQFLKKIAAEKRIFESRTPTIGGSQTQARAVEDKGPASLVKPALKVGGGVAAAIHGGPLGAPAAVYLAGSGLREARDILEQTTPLEREHIARRLADPARALPTLDEIEQYLKGKPREPARPLRPTSPSALGLRAAPGLFLPSTGDQRTALDRAVGTSP